MKSKVILLAVLMCGILVLSGCGSSKTDSTVKEETNVALSSGESDESASSEDDVDLSEKYKDIIGCLENGDYDGAKALIDAMKPQPDTETIPITLDNWSEYFSIEDEYSYTYDANGAVDTVEMNKYLKIKPEYEEKQVSLTGTIGYEYTSVWHAITEINKEDGSFKAEPTDDLPYEETDEETSRTEDLSSPMLISWSSTAAKQGGTGLSGGGIQIKSADDWEKQWVSYPEEINIVRIEGELVLSK